ncbi:MAG: hypothetical protein KAU50_10305, partial [Candidatus Marinimicrobia bacterium]|nr:hypothetical protein [Candidatus Neomarinimicrobiota bacterium]
IIPGEEVTVNNSRRRNMHALVLDHPDYLPGSGDGGENPLKRSSELDLNALSAELGHGTLLIAPHPMYPLPWLQRFVVRRDVWQLADLSHGAVAGLQILNGSLDEGFYRGLSAWKGLLLAGERKFIYGGSDSHGDFNRFRTIKLPFISLLEDDSHVFGSCRTGVYGAQPGNLPDLLDGLRNGRCLVSTGPFMDMSIQSGDNMAHVGESITGSAVTISLTMASTPEFGPLKGWRLYRGEIGGDEQLAAEGLVVGRQFESNWTGDFSLAPGRYYFRAEVETKTVETAILPGLALTNPVWVEAK